MTPPMHLGNQPATKCILANSSMSPGLSPISSHSTFIPSSFAEAIPDDEGVPTPKVTCKRMMRSGPMELMMLDLYVDKVARGKKSDSGFQTSSHWFLAQELRKAFPEVEQMLYFNQVKSKLSQSFKKDYDSFTACKEASGFGWDNFSCEVKASNEVWERFLESHSHAQKLRVMLFPEYWKLEIIFGSSAANSIAACSISQRVQELQTRAAKAMAPEITPSPGKVPMFSTNNSPSSYLAQSHSKPSKNDAIGSAIEGLVSFLQSQSQRRTANCTVQETSGSHIQPAMDLYQEVYGNQDSQQGSLDVSQVFHSETHALIFTSIKDEELCYQWLLRQID